MRNPFGHVASICLILCLLAAGCNLPSGTSAVNAVATNAAATLYALRTAVAATLTAAPPSSTPTLPPVSTALPTFTSAPQDTVVTQLALCWTGPGNAYPVVSSVKAGTSVTLMGVGSIAGWYIIQNPRYHDPCWIQANSLKIDPNYDLSALRIYNPPPTPGPTETPSPVPT